jgi:tetratricopeptide (TPR) repeat protein
MADKETLLPEQISRQVETEVAQIAVEWETGEQSFQEAVDRLTQLQTGVKERPADEAHIEVRFGIMQGYRGNYNASIGHFERARELFIQVGNRQRASVCLMNLGEIYRMKGDFTKARQYFQISYDTATALGDRSTQVTARANEAQMLMSLGRYEQASTILEECHQLCLQPFDTIETDHEHRDRLDQLCEIVCAQADICLHSGNPEEAWKYAAQALRLAEELEVPLRLGFANRTLAETLTVLGSAPEEGFKDDPDTYFIRANEAFREVKADGEIARTLFAHGKSLGKRGKTQAGARKLQQATVIFTKLGMVNDAAKAAEAQIKL